LRKKKFSILGKVRKGSEGLGMDWERLLIDFKGTWVFDFFGQGEESGVDFIMEIIHSLGGILVIGARLG
jgi:hypothetical protein